MVRRWLSLLAVTCLFVHAVSACAGGGELNPQPLPPEDPKDSVGNPSGENDNGTSGGGSPAPESGVSSDAGSSTDAQDSGDAGGDQ